MSENSFLFYTCRNNLYAREFCGSKYEGGGGAGHRIDVFTLYLQGVENSSQKYTPKYTPK